MDMVAFWLLNWVHGGSIHCKKRHWKRKTRFLREDRSFSLVLRPRNGKNQRVKSSIGPQRSSNQNSEAELDSRSLVS